MDAAQSAALGLAFHKFPKTTFGAITGMQGADVANKAYNLSKDSKDVDLTRSNAQVYKDALEAELADMEAKGEGDSIEANVLRQEIESTNQLLSQL